MMYLAGSARPCIPYDVHQCIMISPGVKLSHDSVIKYIQKIIKGLGIRGL